MFSKKMRGLALVLALTMAAAQPVGATSLDEKQQGNRKTAGPDQEQSGKKAQAVQD